MKRWIKITLFAGFMGLLVFIAVLATAHIESTPEPQPALSGDIFCYNRPNPKPSLTVVVKDEAGQPVQIQLGDYLVDDAKGLTAYRIPAAPAGELFFTITCDSKTATFSTHDRVVESINCNQTMSSCSHRNVSPLGADIKWR